MIAQPMAPRHSQGDARKVTVCGKVSPAVAATLARIAEELSAKAHPGSVTLSQLIGHVLEEFVAKHQKTKPKG